MFTNITRRRLEGIISLCGSALNRWRNHKVYITRDTFFTWLKILLETTPPTKMDGFDITTSKIIRMCKEYVEETLPSKLDSIDLTANPIDVDEVLNQMCFVMLGRRLSSDYRQDASDINCPLLSYLESSFYWVQVLRKLNLLEAECGDNENIREKVWHMLEYCRYGIAETHIKNIIGATKERSYLEVVYNPGKYLLEDWSD